MATISGTLLDASDTPRASVPMDFILSTAPVDGDNVFVSGTILRKSTNVDGDYSFTLRPGIYTVRVPSTRQFWIEVPTGTATYSIEDLLYDPGTGILFSSSAIRTFSTVAEMLASDATTWGQAQCTNYNAGDGILSVWIRTSDPTYIPNGTDILQTVGLVTVVRMYVRESDSGVVVPGSGLTTYTVDVPLTVPTVDDLRASVFDAQLVWVGDPSNPMAFVQGNETDSDDGVNGVLNAAGIHYDRVRFQ